MMVCAVAVLALTLATAASAQQADAAARIDSVPLLGGARVRVTMQPSLTRPAIYRYAGVRSDTLLLRPPTGSSVDTTRLALALVTRVEASRGWRQHALVAGLVGAVIGGVIGGVVGYQASAETRRPRNRSTPQSRAGFAVTLGSDAAVAGGALGVVYGRYVLGERWQVVAGR